MKTQFVDSSLGNTVDTPMAKDHTPELSDESTVKDKTDFHAAAEGNFNRDHDTNVDIDIRSDDDKSPSSMSGTALPQYEKYRNREDL